MNEDNEMMKIVQEMMNHICDELCRHPDWGEIDQETLDKICTECKMNQYTSQILNTYDRLNDFDKSETAKLMKKYAKVVCCDECEYRVYEKSTNTYWCRSVNGPVGILKLGDGCTHGRRAK